MRSGSVSICGTGRLKGLFGQRETSGHGSDPSRHGSSRQSELSFCEQSVTSAGLEPVILSHDVFNERSGTVIAVPLTSREPAAVYQLTLESKASGLTKRSWSKVSQIRTLATERIGRRMARASEEELARVVHGLNEIVGD
jgi:mRNA interferase MazF